MSNSPSSPLPADHVLEEHKQQFIRFMLDCKVLRFGQFTAKSGRQTPYFLDAGRYSTGAQLEALGRFYAAAIDKELGQDFDLLFGPAYKGIPLVTATAAQLSRQGRDVGFCFNRKEAKTHGEGGVLVGKQPADGERIVIVEDVTTAGTSIRDTMPILLASAAVNVVGLVVSVDRQEKSPTGQNALRELAQQYSMRAFSIVTIEEILHFLRHTPIDGQYLITPELEREIQQYRAQYGA